MNYAVIKNSKVIAIIGMYPSNWIQFEIVVPAYLNVMVGDDYIMGRFYRNGELVLTPEEILEQKYETEISDMQTALEILGVTE